MMILMYNGTGLRTSKVEVKVAQSCSTLCGPMDYTVHRSLQAKILESFPSPGNLPNPGIEPRSPTLQAAEPHRKPKNTGVGSLSLLQGIFPTQELNWALLHCRRILYQLSYQGSPKNFQYSYKRTGLKYLVICVFHSSASKGLESLF